MKRVCIFLFSGTGMTRYIVGRMTAEFEKRRVSADVFDMENVRARDISFQDYSAVGLAYPVHSFNAPKIVIDFAKGLPKIDPTGTFVISTAGGDSPANQASSDLLVGILRSKGFVVFFEKQFIMPSNFIVRDDDDTVLRKIEKANREIPDAIYGILGFISTRSRPGFVGKAASFFGRLEWIGARCMNFYANNECDRCGLCAANCPNHNIVMDKERAVFRWNCGLCMRCIYLCPKRSVLIRFPFKSLALAKWYDNGELSILRYVNKNR